MQTSEPTESLKSTLRSVLVIRRTLAAKPQRVYDALTQPEQLKQWWGPEGFTTPLAEMDVKTGGTYRTQMVSPEGNSHFLTGKYLEVQPPERVRYTWVWEQGDLSGVETIVTFELREVPEGTELTLTHELPTDSARTAHNQGWTSSLNCLDQLFTS